MSIRKLPAPSASTVNTHDLRCEVHLKALDRWNPGIRAAASEDGDTSISIFDVIGQGFFSDGVTSKRVAAALRSIDNHDVTVNINSPGGDYFEGLTIYNLLRQHPARVMVNVMGLAASAASVIAMAGDEVRIARAGFFMIHNTQWVAAGDRNLMREAADQMEAFDQAAVDIYAARTGLDEEELGQMLDAETWLSGRKAVDLGFADGFLAADDMEDGGEGGARAALSAHRLDTLMAKMGVPRSERRKLIREIRGTPSATATGMPRAADDGMPSAVVHEGINDLLSQLRSM
jgi:ATP-dependent Clp protease, protease subunit